MKKRFYQLGKKVAILSAVAICALLTANQTFAQGVSINATGTGTAPDGSAILDLNIVTKGFLVPRMTQAQRNAIGLPATSLLIYQTDNTPGFYYNSGTPGVPVWTTFGGGSGPTAGNDIDVTGTQVDVESDLDFVKQITAPLFQDLTLRTQGSNIIFGTSTPTEFGRFNTSGNFGVGDANPASLFTVGSGDLFQVNSSGNLIAINGLTGYSWPAGHASGVLRNNGTGTLTWGAPTISGAAALTNGRIWIGDASNIAQEQTMSGDATISNTGALTLATVATAGTNTKVTYNAKGLVTSGTAAILASADFANQGATTNVLHGNASGNPTWGAVTGADFGTQVANTVFSGPASGANAIPTFRTMVPLDLATGPVNGQVLGVTAGVLDWVATLTNPMTNAGDMIYAPVAGAPAAAVRFPAGTNGNVLHTTGGLPSWSPLNMAGGVDEVTGILPVGNGGTGLATLTAGSILYGNGAGTVNLLAGTDAQTIRFNGTTPIANSNLLNNGTNIGIGIPVGDFATTDAILDIIGSNTLLGTGDSVALSLRMGDGQNLPSDVSQITFGYSGTKNYRHAIKTRHNSTVGTANAIDFYVWKPGVDAAGSIGTNRVFTIFNNGTSSGVELYGGILTNASWGTAGQVLASGGAGVAPTWTSAASGTVTSVTGTSPINVATGTTTPVISLQGAAGTIAYGTGGGSAFSAAGTVVGQILQSNTTGAPTWSTASYPATTAINTLLYSSAANTVVALPTVNSSVLTTTAGGVPTWSTVASMNADLTVQNGLYLSAGTTYDGSAAVTIKQGGILTETTLIDNTGFAYTLGGAAATHTITIGSSSAAQTLNLGTGAGLSTVNIANGAAANVVNINNGASAGTIQIGNNNKMTITNLGVGIGGLATATNALVVVGKVKSTGINETSDVRLKKNIVSIDGALNKVLSMNGKYYDWRTTEFPNKGLEEGRQVGVIAQEIEKILPEVVVTDDDGFKSVEYGHIVPVLIEAIKEQQKIIDGQKSTISDLKASLENVLNRVNVIEKNVDINNSKVEK